MKLLQLPPTPSSASHPRKRMGSTTAGENKKAPKASEAEAPPSTTILEAALEELPGETHREKEQRRLPH
jgi:hypothetical protein